VVAIDGEPAEARMQRLGRYVAAATEAAHRLSVARRMLGGSDGSLAVITLRGGSGPTRDVRLVRSRSPDLPQRTGEVVRVLPGNVGYMDLDRLEAAQVGAALDRLKETRGLVLDLRGYPHGTAWVLAPRLNVKGARWGAAFQRPLVSGAGEPGERLSFLQELPSAAGWKYSRPVITLIDERAMSQAEHTGLFLEAACDTRFVGTPTAGTNGDVTAMILPGGLTVRFTGHDVRHADGRQLQRIGLQPHVRVAPSIAGLRAGRDEVLERAVQELVNRK
jgi:C-terminal processing protease CtpA/Prc